MEDPRGQPVGEGSEAFAGVRPSWKTAWIVAAVLFTLVLAAPAGMFEFMPYFLLLWLMRPPAEPGEFVCLTGLVLLGPPVGLVFGGVLAYFGGTALYSNDRELKQKHLRAARITSILYAVISLPGALMVSCSNLSPGAGLVVLFVVRYYALIVLAYSLERLIHRQLGQPGDS